ncbi:hypothetical protein HG535_0B06150 [Zygotorulaspora mrakii]|uniref:Mediator of RNA polymerase II transcription subunit 18 n=1 Tax=Zygotorulaspora mrakii TaxID=42260 RepID=A0A7H9AZ21_ZYGMR|nr:uncharacterized protein HG535_0B06150 [Zygotorulaspora mrakii]QLG71571.1 hypothetical protein HG535_0B06150 [Zygotorulaspora mrakii]
MVHQLSLFGTIDDKSYDLFLSTMSILSGTPPVLFANITNVWTTNKSYEFERVNSKNQLTELNRIKVSKSLPLQFLIVEDDSVLSHKLLKKIGQLEAPIEPSALEKYVQDIKYERASSLGDDSKMDVDASSMSEPEAEPWALSMSDIPAAGKSRKVSMQTISESIILTTGGTNSSTSSFLKELGYVPEYRYITVGVKFYMANDMVLDIQKLWDLRNDRSLQITKGGYLIKAYVNVNRSTDIERINQAETALLSLQKELQGYVDLVVPDRKAMDSRLNNMGDII